MHRFLTTNQILAFMNIRSAPLLPYVMCAVTRSNQTTQSYHRGHPLKIYTGYQAFPLIWKDLIPYVPPGSSVAAVRPCMWIGQVTPVHINHVCVYCVIGGHLERTCLGSHAALCEYRMYVNPISAPTHRDRPLPMYRRPYRGHFDKPPPWVTHSLMMSYEAHGS